MSSEHYFTYAASAMFLGLAALSAARGGKSPLAMPTALLCVDLFAYNSLELLGNLTAQPFWQWLEAAFAALAAPLLFHLTLAFLGARRENRRWLIATYAYFGALAASCLLPLARADLAAYPGGDVWALVMLSGVVPTFLYAATRLVQHYRASGSAEERARTQLFMGTVLVGVGGPATDLSVIAGAAAIPRLSASAMLLSAILLTALALRFRLMRGTVPLLIVNAVLIGVVGVVLQVLVFLWVGQQIALLVLGTVVVTLVLLGAARAVWTAFTEHRERTAHLATLGRLSAQMAHDIRNPLAAIKGAAQYLEEEMRRGGAADEPREILALILEQTDRLERVVSEYRRLGAAEPQLGELDVNQLVRGVVDGARLALGPETTGVTIRVDVDVRSSAMLDETLVATALENLVRNAVEGLEAGGGEIVVRAIEERVRGRDSVVLTVRDDGPGMDARTREQAQEAFFTTKASGSGLGLAFVRRVADAHGGALQIESALGHGTTVRVVLPRKSPP